MNIWFAADIPQNSYGGVGRSMKELAAGLKSNGHVTTIITRGSLLSDSYLIFAVKLCIRYILSFFHPPDWIIARSTDAVFCAIIIKLFKLKTCIILHNHGWEEYAYTIERKLPRRIITAPTTWKSLCFRFPLLRIMLKLATYCMSGTEHEIVYIGNKYLSVKHKLIYVPNGVTPQTEGYWLNTPADSPHFLCIGNVTWKKGLAHSLRTFSLLRNEFPDARLTCVGTGVDFETLSRYTGSDLAGVTNVSSVPFEEMHTWYTTCPFMLASSRYEGGHSFAILEALSYGIIVFASAIPSNREIITDSENGYIITGSSCNYDAGKITQKLSMESNQNIRLHAIQTALQNSWHKQIERLEKILCRKQ